MMYVRRAGVAVSACLVLALTLAACGAPSGTDARSAPASGLPAGRGGINRVEQQEKPYLILISFDAFRADYLDRFDLPNFRRVMQRGVRARALIPVFPTLTFPNHYSLVTGLTPERHGIVANSFYDPERRQTYRIRDTAAVGDGTWYRGEPLWVTAETQGMVSACFFWPGSEAAIKGVRPTFWTKYDGTVPNTARIDRALEWLRLPPDRRPHLITLYFGDLDSASHDGPLDAPAVAHAATMLDGLLGRLLDGIDALPIRDGIYLLLTSDHGMVETSVSKTIMLNSLIDTSRLQTAFGGPVASLHLKSRDAEEARMVRDQVNARLEHGRAYLRDEVPEGHHYRADPRIGDVVIVMEESWSVETSILAKIPIRKRWGTHGWDPEFPSMHGIFVVAGPGIDAGVTIAPVRNIDVYPLMTELLGLRPAARLDGEAGRIRGLLSQPR
jgi:predicted AlkP superfamily pyrophosphatase or phosphodiesterase